MAKVQAPIKFTYEDYKSLPESETKRYELLGGELVMVPAPIPYHQDLSRNLFRRLDEHVRTRRLGKAYYAPVDIALGEDVVQPDILFISNARSAIVREEEIRGAPDLIIEILSPGTAQRDRTYKRTLYARNGVREYWLVDPEARTIEVLTLGLKGFRQAGRYEQGQTLASPLLPGLKISLDEVF